MTDASQSGIGHILQQNIGGAWQPIAFSHCSLVSLIFKKEGYYSVSHSKVMCNFSIWPDLWDFQASGSPDFLEKIAKT